MSYPVLLDNIVLVPKIISLIIINPYSHHIFVELMYCNIIWVLQYRGYCKTK